MVGPPVDAKNDMLQQEPAINKKKRSSVDGSASGE